MHRECSSERSRSQAGICTDRAAAAGAAADDDDDDFASITNRIR